MRPTRETEHAVVDVLDVILRKGAMIQADVLVSVADIPLVGINLRAAVAGMTAMREYGFFENWDVEKRRATEDRRSEAGRRPAPTLSGATSATVSDLGSEVGSEVESEVGSGVETAVGSETGSDAAADAAADRKSDPGTEGVSKRQSDRDSSDDRRST